LNNFHQLTIFNVDEEESAPKSTLMLYEYNIFTCRSQTW
jgi:hypothetical protein